MIRRSAILAILVTLLVPAASWGETAVTSCYTGTQISHLYLANSLAASSDLCEIELVGSSFETFDIRIATTPIDHVRFSLPNPPVGTLLGVSWNYPATGDLSTGVELDLGGCTSTGYFVLGTVFVDNMPPVTDCQQWKIDDGAEVDYCTGGTSIIMPWDQSFKSSGATCPCSSWQWCLVLPPTNLFPADGATSVPLNVELSCCDGCDIRISTDPDCATEQTFACGTLPSNYLQPLTTYYWRLAVNLTGGGCSNVVYASSPTQSFTTEGPVASETHTWGAIKALYD